MHHTTFEHLTPTAHQMETMDLLRQRFALLAADVIALVPVGPDKTYLLRKLRECAMWANVAITRQPDGSPRAE